MDQRSSTEQCRQWCRGLMTAEQQWRSWADVLVGATVMGANTWEGRESERSWWQQADVWWGAVWEAREQADIWQEWQWRALMHGKRVRAEQWWWQQVDIWWEWQWWVLMHGKQGRAEQWWWQRVDIWWERQWWALMWEAIFSCSYLTTTKVCRTSGCTWWHVEVGHSKCGYRHAPNSFGNVKL